MGPSLAFWRAFTLAWHSKLIPELRFLFKNPKTLKMNPDNKPCRFIGGKYASKTGWLDASRQESAQMVPVIVDLGARGHKSTRVRRENVASPRRTANSFFEAAIIQHPDIDALYVSLCKELAKCSLSKEDNLLAQAYFANCLALAKKNIKKQGHKACFRMVNFRR